jgi:hypothetical protein
MHVSDSPGQQSLSGSPGGWSGPVHSRQISMQSRGSLLSQVHSLGRESQTKPIPWPITSPPATAPIIPSVVTILEISAAVTASPRPSRSSVAWSTGTLRVNEAIPSSGKSSILGADSSASCGSAVANVPSSMTAHAALSNVIIFISHDPMRNQARAAGRYRRSLADEAPHSLAALTLLVWFSHRSRSRRGRWLGRLEHPRARDGCTTLCTTRIASQQQTSLEERRTYSALTASAQPHPVVTLSLWDDWWARQDSNLRQHRYERRVLTTELRARRASDSRWRVMLPSGIGGRSGTVQLGGAIVAPCCFDHQGGRSDTPARTYARLSCRESS